MQKIIVIISLFISFGSFGQDSTQVKKQTGTNVIVYTNWSNTYRTLKVNEGLFASPIGVRADEESSNFWSFGIGFQSDISKHFMWEGGMAYQRNGEKYSFEQLDTMYSYNTQYSYISMPIKLYYKTGQSFKLVAGVGVVPQIFIGYKQNVNWENSSGSEGSESITSKVGYNSFVLSTVFNLGTEIEMNEKWSLLILPEYKLQLTNTYGKKASYKHFARAIGFNMGLLIKI